MAQNDVPRIQILWAEMSNPSRLAREIGNEAVNHFKDNFRLQGFLDGGLQKWKDVKRRDPNSPWYGFDYRGNKSKGKKKKGKKGRKSRNANFSQAATQRPILTGTSMELQRSLAYKVNTASSRQISLAITSDKPYASVQNEGGMIKVFGKHTAVLPARPFVGHSKELDDKIDKIVLDYLKLK